jgi:hypothetical protein
MTVRPAAYLILFGLAASVRYGLGAPAPVEDAVLEAVVRARLAEFRIAAGADSRKPAVFCLAINPGDAPQTPGRDFMALFKHQPDVRTAGQCETRDGRVVEIGTAVPALLLTLGPLEWIAADEAWVTTTVLRDRPYPPPVTYRVVREQDRWTALGPVVKIAPA